MPIYIIIGSKLTTNPNYGLNKEIKVQLRRGKQGKLKYFINN
ncbi:hypothetical protein [Wolbachia endosymbiont (group B) of Pammene fasciana]|nr:hypothetical protein [Wolbachia endosymbiont (group B) of Pammene fasciana]